MPELTFRESCDLALEAMELIDGNVYQLTPLQRNVDGGIVVILSKASGSERSAVVGGQVNPA